jgi:hypothetical protein
MEQLENSFKKPVNRISFFDFFIADDGKVAITRSAAINYFQITPGGHMEKKRAAILTLDETRYEAYLLMKERDWKWSLSSK